MKLINLPSCNNVLIYLEVDAVILSKMVKIQDTMGQRLWKCAECDYAKKLKGDVFKHVERKHVELTVTCDICSLSYCSRQELKTHIKIKHPFVN